MAEPSKQDLVHWGKQVKDFLTSDAWKYTEERMRKAIADKFVAVSNPDQALVVWHQSKAFDELLHIMRSAQQRGETIEIEEAKEAKAKGRK